MAKNHSVTYSSFFFVFCLDSSVSCFENQFLFVKTALVINLCSKICIMPTFSHYPALTADGWTNEPVKVIDFVLADFYTLKHSQTVLFSVDSFPYLVYTHGRDAVRFAEQLKQALLRMFADYFKDIECNVYLNDAELGARFSVTFSLVMYDSLGARYDVSRLLEAENMQVKKVINTVNGQVLF